MKRSRFVRYLIALGIEAIIALTIILSRGGFITRDREEWLHLLSDAFAIPGILCVCLGLLIVVSNGGVFDMVRFAFSKVSNTFRREENRKNIPDTYYDYVCARHNGKSAGFRFLLGSGAFFLIASIIMLFSMENIL